MKLETVLSEYSVLESPVGCFEAVLSPEGWDRSQFVSYATLNPNEIVEFTNIIHSFFHECKTQNDLKKFCKKHGTNTDAVTDSFRLDCALMAYIVRVTGYSVTMLAYRKENVE